MSLIAAQISSVFAVITSSTVWRMMRKVSLPICATATPSAKMPTCDSTTRRFAFSAASRQAASSGSTPITRTEGRTYLM